MEWKALHLPSFLIFRNLMRQAEAEAIRMTKAFLVMDTPLDLLVNILIIAMYTSIGRGTSF